MNTPAYTFTPLTFTYTGAQGACEPITFAFTPSATREQIRNMVENLSIVERAVLKAYAAEILEAP